MEASVCLAKISGETKGMIMWLRLSDAEAVLMIACS